MQSGLDSDPDSDLDLDVDQIRSRTQIRTPILIDLDLTLTLTRIRIGTPVRTLIRTRIPCLLPDDSHLGKRRFVASSEPRHLHPARRRPHSRFAAGRGRVRRNIQRGGRYRRVLRHLRHVQFTATGHQLRHRQHFRYGPSFSVSNTLRIIVIAIIIIIIIPSSAD